jgi:hypothetical protein
VFPAAAFADPLSQDLSLPPPGKPVLLELVPRVGIAARLGDSPALPIAVRGGYTLGLAVGLRPSRWYGIELGYEHFGILTEGDTGNAGWLEVTRTVDAGWAMLRGSAFRLSALDLYFGLGVGLATDRATAVGLATGARSPFQCVVTGPIGLALRAGIGSEVRLGPRVSFLTEVGATSAQLSSDPMDDCAPGTGTLSLIGLRAGVVYRFDVSRYVR